MTGARSKQSGVPSKEVRETLQNAAKTLVCSHCDCIKTHRCKINVFFCLDFLTPFIALNKSGVHPPSEALEARGQLAADTVFYSNRRIIAGMRGEGVGVDFVSKAAQNCCFVYSLGSAFRLLLLLHISGPSHSVVAASCQTAERGTLDRKKIFTPPICHPPCSTHLTGTRKGMWGSGVKKKKKKTSQGKRKRVCLRNVCLTS